jgi:hypothetical protein
LNDLFGIQARGGCSCAGPYGHRLLGIDDETTARIETAVADGCEVIKPGWVRVNFNYFIPEEEFEYIIEAVHMTARDGWRLLPLYEFESSTAIWRHQDGLPEPPASLIDVSFAEEPRKPPTIPIEVLSNQLIEAAAVLDSPITAHPASTALPEIAEALRWFPSPGEAVPPEAEPNGGKVPARPPRAGR